MNAAGIDRHLDHEREEVLLHLRRVRRAVPDLDEGDDFLLVEHRREQHEVRGWIAGDGAVAFEGAAGGRRDDGGLGLQRRLPQQLIVHGPVFGRAIDADLADAGLALQNEVALRRANPDRASRRLQRLQQQLEELAVEFRRAQVRLRDASNLLLDLGDLAAGLLDLIGVHWQDLVLRGTRYETTARGQHASRAEPTVRRSVRGSTPGDYRTMGHAMAIKVALLYYPPWAVA